MTTETIQPLTSINLLGPNFNVLSEKFGHSNLFEFFKIHEVGIIGIFVCINVRLN